MNKEVFDKAKSLCDEMSTCLEILRKLDTSKPFLRIDNDTYEIPESLTSIIKHYYRDVHNECQGEFSKL